MDAVDIYGLSEVIGPGVANECVETKDGPTIWEDHFYPEIIDPETGEVLPDGEHGRAGASPRSPRKRCPSCATARAIYAAPAADRPVDAAHGAHQRPDRRHADHPRRERVPDPGRGADPRHARLAPHYVLEVRRQGPLDSLTVDVEQAPGRRRRARSTPPRSSATHQGPDRRYGGGPDARAGANRALRRQGEARHRPALGDASLFRETR